MLLEAFDLFFIDFEGSSVNISDMNFVLFLSIGGEGQWDVEVGESSGFFFEVVFESVVEGVEFGLSVGHEISGVGV